MNRAWSLCCRREAENASGGEVGLTHWPVVEGNAAVEQQIALDALLAAQVAEELEGRHASTAGGAAGGPQGHQDLISR